MESKHDTILKLKELYAYQKNLLEESQDKIDEIRQEIEAKEKSSRQYSEEIDKRITKRE